MNPVGMDARVHWQYWVRKVYRDPWPEMALCLAAPETLMYEFIMTTSDSR
jgi:hypothetical protein